MEALAGQLQKRKKEATKTEELKHGCKYPDEPMEYSERFSKVLCQCSCFGGIPENHYGDVLSCLRAQNRRFKKGSMILQAGSGKDPAGIVLGGTVELTFYSESGSQININHCQEGDLFGEDLACSDLANHSMQVWAVSDCEILFLDFTSLFSTEGGTCPFKMRVSTNLLREFARKANFLNDKVRILAQKRLRDKIKIYLQTCKCDSDGRIAIPFRRNSLAEFLCVDRSALSRELGRMEREGIIRLENKCIKVCDKEFLL